MKPTGDIAAVEPGRVVALHYTLFDEADQVLDASDEAPIQYLHGADNIVEGLEEALTGHTAGEEVRAVVPPAKGYGLRDEEAVQTVPRAQFPDDVELEPGLPLGAEAPDGRKLTVWVVEVGEGEVTLDLNHPLAGRTLRFDVRIESVREATADELAAGRPLS